MVLCARVLFLVSLSKPYGRRLPHTAHIKHNEQNNINNLNILLNRSIRLYLEGNTLRTVRLLFFSGKGNISNNLKPTGKAGDCMLSFLKFLYTDRRKKKTKIKVLLDLPASCPLALSNFGDGSRLRIYNISETTR